MKKKKQVSGNGSVQQTSSNSQDSSAASDQSVDKSGASGNSGPVIDPRYRGVVCFNCGEPGYFVGLCTKEKCCFICGKPGHHMDVCPEWYKPFPMAQYWGSANTGLGFFHLEVDGKDAISWLNIDNVGIVNIEGGEISIQELEQCFTDMWKTNWVWQMRLLEDKKVLVRFPPNKKITELVEYPSINLKKKGVSISFANWSGELPAYGELKEVWVTVEGLPPKWWSWKVFGQVASSLGVLVNIDWHEIFRSFYKNLRFKISVRDVSKIPRDRLFEVEQNFFLLQFSIDRKSVV